MRLDRPVVVPVRSARLGIQLARDGRQLRRWQHRASGLSVRRSNRMVLFLHPGRSMPKVFLLEPDPSLREWCRLHLSTDGFAVVPFDDGRRALEALRVEPPELVMIATNLAGMSAFALAAAIRSNVRSALTPILFLVPGKDTAALSQALAIEPQGVVSKPLTRELLLESVHARLGNPLVATATGQQSRRPEPATPSTSARGTASGPLLETKQATVLVVAVRNFVSLARALSASVLDRFMSEFAAHAREAIFASGGWIVRADAMSMVALFEDVPDQTNPHSARALEAALGAVLASRVAKRWGESALPNRASLDVSVGCGVHTGEVIVARLTVGGNLSPCIAGQTADLAQRLEGRAKGLHWSIACSEAVVLQAGTRFEIGHRSSLTDTDHDVTIPIVEVRGYAPGAARPGELARMGEVREAMLANTLLASLAGDVDQQTAERTILVRGARPAAEALPSVPGRRIERRAKQSSSADAYLATHLQSGRKELIEIVRLADRVGRLRRGVPQRVSEAAEDRTAQHRQRVRGRADQRAGVRGAGTCRRRVPGRRATSLAHNRRCAQLSGAGLHRARYPAPGRHRPR